MVVAPRVTDGVRPRQDSLVDARRTGGFTRPSLPPDSSMRPICPMLALDAPPRARVWQELVDAVEAAATSDELSMFAELDAADVRAFVERLDFEVPVDAVEAVRFAVEGLSRYAVNIRSPRYFGLFDPAPAAM